MEREAPPPGFEWTGNQTEIRLIDPPCGRGHPLQGRWTRPGVECSEHRWHNSWLCGCGVETYLLVEDGQASYVTELPCRDPDFGRSRSL